MYSIRILDEAAKELARLDKSSAQRVIQRINWLSTNAEFLSHQSLSGPLTGLFKLRVGVYRIIYEILPGEQLVIIHQIGHRRDIYRF